MAARTSTRVHQVDSELFIINSLFFLALDTAVDRRSTAVSVHGSLPEPGNGCSDVNLLAPSRKQHYRGVHRQLHFFVAFFWHLLNADASQLFFLKLYYSAGILKLLQQKKNLRPNDELAITRRVVRNAIGIL